MTEKHNYGGKPPAAMLPQRGGTPRNTGSPPPDVPPESFSHPPVTQSAPATTTSIRPPGAWAPQPGARPHEKIRPTGPGPGVGGHDGGSTPQKATQAERMAKQGTMGDRPTGTAVPERRAMDTDGDTDGTKGGGSPMGGVPGSVGQPLTIPDDAFSIANPSVTPGYKPPGRPDRR